MPPVNAVAEAVRLDKLAAVGELAGHLAHEINNPLFAILGLVELLLAGVEPGSKLEERLRLIQETGLEIKETIRTVSEFNKEPSDAVRSFDVAEAAAKAAALARRTSALKAVPLLERYSEDPLVLTGSPNQITQVVLRLLTRAQSAAAAAGTPLELTVERTAQGADVSVGPAEDEIGSELGVARAIARAHGGELALRGRAWVLSLPAAAGE